MSDYFDIDLNNLDKEWGKQARKFHKKALALALAKDELQRADAELDLVRAELDLAIRENPAQYDLPKLTDAGVKTAVIVQKEYRMALAEVNRKRHEVEVHLADVRAMEHKKKALEKLVDLRLADYFSEPRPKSKRSKKHRDDLDWKRIMKGGTKDDSYE